MERARNQGELWDSGHPARIRQDGFVARGDSTRVPELDGVRGLAALIIVVFHANARWIPWGWASVDLFFVLSGYLITSIILDHGRSRGFLLAFYARRALRIWPLYFLMIGLVAAATPWLTRPTDWSCLPAILTFSQGVTQYWSGRISPMFSVYLAHTWTLAIEEQFYVIWPAVVLLLGRGRLIPLALGVAVFSVVARSRGWHFALLLARADGLALGGLLAALWSGVRSDATRSRMLARGSLAALVAGVVGVWWLGGNTFLLRTTRPGPTIFAYNVLFVGAVGLVVTRAGSPALGWLRRRSLIWLGTVSYGLYLIHHILFMILADIQQARGIPGRPAWLFVPAILLSLVLAGLSYRWFEAPILRLKSRFRYEAPPARGETHAPHFHEAAEIPATS